MFLKNCIDVNSVEEIKENCTVLSDVFIALDKIKDKSVDLLIVDPPYNLSKNFHGNDFKKLNGEEYSLYTRKWIEKVKPKLKDTASVYVCCDWQSALYIGTILSEYFILRNRITWQREKGRGAKANWKNSMEDIFSSAIILYSISKIKSSVRGYNFSPEVLCALVIGESGIKNGFAAADEQRRTVAA